MTGALGAFRKGIYLNWARGEPWQMPFKNQASLLPKTPPIHQCSNPIKKGNETVWVMVSTCSLSKWL